MRCRGFPLGFLQLVNLLFTLLRRGRYISRTFVEEVIARSAKLANEKIVVAPPRQKAARCSSSL